MYEWTKKERLLCVLAFVCLAALAACFYWLDRTYDGAVQTGAVYYLVFAGAHLVATLVRPTFSGAPRGSAVSLLAVGTALLFAVVCAAMILLNPRWMLLYNFSVHLLIGLLIAAFALFLYRRKHPKRAETQRPAAGRLLFVCGFCLYIMGMLAIYLAFHRPMPLEAAKPLAAEQDMTYIGRLTGDRDENPLGLYWFSDQASRTDPDANAYLSIDVLTGAVIPSPYD